MFFKAEFKVSFEEASSFPPSFCLSLTIRWRIKEIKRSWRTVVIPIAISASPCLPIEKLIHGLGSPSAPLHWQSQIAFSRLPLCAEAFPSANFESWHFSSCRVSVTDSTSLSAVQSYWAGWNLRHTNRLAGWSFCLYGAWQVCECS